MRHFLRAAFLLMGLAMPLLADNWPNWRGHDGQGHCNEKNLPVKWSAKENVRWKVPMPDEGNSSPVIWGERIFVTQASEKKDWPPKGGNGGAASAYKRALLCFQRSDGKPLWTREATYKEIEYTHPTNPYCSASPAVDAERVIVSHGSAGMFCYDHDGKELWKYDLGKLEHIWGNASSPILYGDLAILWAGPGDRQFLLAVNKKNGTKVWEKEIAGGSDGIKNKSWLGSWSTPIIVKVDGQDEMVVGVPKQLKSFDPKTGNELWSCDGLGPLVYTSPVYGNGVFVQMSGFHGPAMAVKSGGRGDITKTHRLWHQAQKVPQRIGSPVVVGPHVYIVNAEGTAQCLELETGKDLWDKERIPGQTWSSLIHADGKFYLNTMGGDTMVLAANPKFEILARNSLGERNLSTIAISNGELFIRTYKHLWCIAEKKQ